MLTISEIVDDLNRFAPPAGAAAWDNVGLLLGERGAEVWRVMTCLTVTPETADEAIENGAELIVSHHPVLFRPVNRLTNETSEGRMLLSLLRAGIAVYSPHTAFDNVAGGINDILARRLDLADVEPLRRGETAKQCKLVAFVPDTDLARVAEALFASGAGRIGEYSQCSFRTAGTGTYFGSAASQPSIGEKGRREEVNEWRLEVVCPESAVPAAVAALRQAHSYEEPAFDVYPLATAPAAHGQGRVGRLPAPMLLADFAALVKQRLNSGPVQMIGDPNKSVERVALACGAAGEFFADAQRVGADVFLTGEMRFHDYLTARAGGVALILPGHYATERCGVEDLAERIQKKWPDVTVWASRNEADPVQWG